MVIVNHPILQINSDFHIFHQCKTVDLLFRFYSFQMTVKGYKYMEMFGSRIISAFSLFNDPVRKDAR